jgi:hypothetical protein
MTSTVSPFLINYLEMKYAEVAALEAEIAAGQAAVESSKLKRSPKTLALIAKNEALKRQIEELRESFQEYEQFIRKSEQWIAESAEVDAWAARGYTGQRPVRIRRDDAVALKEFLADSVALPIRRHF